MGLGARRARDRGRDRAGRDVVYQAVFLDGEWRGLADFLIAGPTAPTRPSTPSSRGTRSRRTCSSSASTPSRSGASRGGCPSGCTSSSAPASARAPAHDFLAYYRRVRERFLDVASDDRGRPSPSRSPTASICDFLELCEALLGRARPPRRGSPACAATRSCGSARPGSRRSPRSATRRPRPPSRASGRGDLREHPPPGRAPAPPRRHRRARLSRPCRRDERGFALLPEAVAGRPLLRHGGRPVLGAERRARVPLRRRSGTRTASRASRLLGARPRRASGARSRSFVDFVARAARAPSRPARLPLRALRADRAQAAHGRVRDARGGGRRPPPRRGLRRPLRGRRARRCGSRSRATRQEPRGSSTSSARPSVKRGRRRRSSCTSEWLETGDDAILDEIARLQRGGLPLDLLLRDWLLELKAEATAKFGADPGAAARVETREEPRARQVARADLHGVSLARDGEPGCRCSPQSSSTTTAARRKPVWWAFFDARAR